MKQKDLAIDLYKKGFSPSQIAFKVKVPKTRVEAWLGEIPKDNKIINNCNKYSSNINIIKESHKPIFANILGKFLPIGFCIVTTIFLSLEASKVIGSAMLAVLLEVGLLLLASTNAKDNFLKVAKWGLLTVATAINISILTLGNYKGNDHKIQTVQNNNLIAASIQDSLSLKKKELNTLIENKYIGRSAKVSAEISTLESELKKYAPDKVNIQQSDFILIALVAATRAILSAINLIIARSLKKGFQNE